MLFGTGTASAAKPTVAETRVGASTPTTVVVVGPHECITAGQRWGNAPPQIETTVATGVAAKTVPEVVGPARSTDLVLDSFRGLGPGKQKTVRTVGSVDEMRATFDAWSVGAERLPARGPKIPDVYRLPDGGVIQWRAGSTTGGPTIDILPVGGAPRKVHLADGVAW